jgi:hypothetical protein
LSIAAVQPFQAHCEVRLAGLILDVLYRFAPALSFFPSASASGQSTGPQGSPGQIGSR